MIISCEFERAIKYIFQNCDETSLKNGKSPFNSCVRALLIDSILTNLKFKKIKNKTKNATSTLEVYLNDVKSKVDAISSRGLPYMLSENYFDDAFILHDPTNHAFNIQSMIEHSLTNTDKNQNTDKVRTRENPHSNQKNQYKKTDDDDYYADEVVNTIVNNKKLPVPDQDSNTFILIILIILSTFSRFMNLKDNLKDRNRNK
jgi:hypothetical protein